jgi:hypothetical protein
MAKWPDDPNPETGGIPELESPQQRERGDLTDFDLSKLGLPPREQTPDEQAPDEQAPDEQAPGELSPVEQTPGEQSRERSSAIEPELSRFAPRPPGVPEPWRAPQPAPSEPEPPAAVDPERSAADVAAPRPAGLWPDEPGPDQPEPAELAPAELEPAEPVPDEPVPDEPDDDLVASEPWDSTPNTFSGFDAFPDEDEAPLPPVRPRRDARSTLRIGARAVAGTVGIGIAAAAIAAATWLPLPHYVSTPPSMVVTPAATTQQRVCPGPALRPADARDGNANASAIASVGHPDVTAASATGAAGTAPLKATENGAGIAPMLLTLPASANAALAGSQSESVSAGGFAGFAAAECAETAAETWLVGGATDIGRFTLITLSNPGTVSATVSVTVFTEAGEVHAAGSDGIVVPGGSQRILPLAGFAPNVLSPVVRVRSAGGQVVANLQHGIVRTLAPGGLAIVGASAAPAKQLAIPGVVLTGTEAIATQQNSPGFADIAPVLRLYVPGTAEATVRIAVIPEDGSAPGEPSSLSVPGGVVTDVPIQAGDGSFTISLSADIPFIAAARASASGSSGAVDLTWFAAAPVLHHSAEVAIAAGPSPVLHLANPTRQTQTVTLASADAPDASVSVPAGASVTVPAASGAYLLSGFDSLQVAVSYQGDGQLSGFTVSPGAPSAPPIRVYP